MKLILTLLIIIQFGSSFGDLVRLLKDVVANTTSKTTCIESLMFYLDNLIHPREDLWAWKMLDASTKSLIPSGMLNSLNFGEMGDFDGCLSAESIDQIIKPRYCLGHFSFMANFFTSSKPPKEFDHLMKYINHSTSLSNVLQQKSTSIPITGPTWALCLPSVCTSEEINSLFNKIQLTFMCQTQDDANPSLTNGAIATIVFFCIIIAAMALSTAYDVLHKGNEPPSQILLAFSVSSNWKNLMRMDESPEFPCMDGIRFFSMMWVVMGHLAMVVPMSSLTNFREVLRWSDTWHSMIFVNATLSVDTFFVVGGALLAYKFLKSRLNGQTFNIFKYYIYRYLRLTPALAAWVLVCSTSLSYMGSGPNWTKIVQIQENCSKYSWSILLQIQNYINVENMCLEQSWYVNADMQLYILSPLLLFPLWYYPKISLPALFLLTGTSIVANFFIAYENNLWAIISSLTGHGNEFMAQFYRKTHTRATTWLMGIALGYYLYLLNYKNVKFPRLRKELLLIIWALCITILITCIFSGHSTLRGPEYNRYGNAFYISLVRPACALCIAWIIIACVVGYGGVVNTILSLPTFQVLNRFTYSMYIVHLTLMYLKIHSQKAGTFFSVFNLIFDFWGYFMYSFGLSIFWVLAFESPFVVLGKALTKIT